MHFSVEPFRSFLAPSRSAANMSHSFTSASVSMSVAFGASMRTAPVVLFVIVVHEILYAKVVTAHTYPYQPNGNGFKGAIPRVTLLALQTTTPDRNADRLPVPGVLWELTQLHVGRGAVFV